VRPKKHLVARLLRHKHIYKTPCFLNVTQHKEATEVFLLSR